MIAELKLLIYNYIKPEVTRYEKQYLIGCEMVKYLYKWKAHTSAAILTVFIKLNIVFHIASPQSLYNYISVALILQPHLDLIS